MNCPLLTYYIGTLGTVDYLAPCECLKLCEYTSCKYRRCGFLVQAQSLGTTTTNTLNLVGTACYGSMPLIKASDNALVTNADLTAGTVYRVYPVSVSGILKGVVQGI